MTDAVDGSGATLESLRQALAHARRELEDARQELEDARQELKDARASADRYKALYDALPVSVYVVDHDGIIVGVNPFHLKTMGKGRTTEEDYVGKLAAARPSIVAAGLAEKAARLVAGVPFEARDVHFPALSGGGEGWCDVRGVPLVSNGEVVGGICITMDVTDYHNVKEELRRHVEKLEKTLSGFIPICASCKRIRDKEGRWNRLEMYLSERTEVEFTHGLCPECTRRLYPDLKVDE